MLSPSNIGPMQMLMVLAIVLIIFGPKKLPSLARAIGRSVQEFKDGLKGIGEAIDEEDPGKASKTSNLPSGDLDPKPTPRVNDVASSGGEEPAKQN